MLCRPVKYAPVTAQNCRPQMVNRAMRMSTTSVPSAVIAQASPIQISESTRPLLQSIDGENGLNSSIGTPLLRLATWLRESYRRFTVRGCSTPCGKRQRPTTPQWTLSLTATQSRWIFRRLGLLDCDQGLVGPALDQFGLGVTVDGLGQGVVEAGPMLPMDGTAPSPARRPPYRMNGARHRTDKSSPAKFSS